MQFLDPQATYTTICVSKHKTGTTGRAKVTVSGPLSKLLAQYVQHLRPMHAESMLLFPNQTGRPLDHLSRHVQKLGAQYQLTLPTATEGRHAAATAATLHCTEREQAAVATLMSHSHQTQRRYYANVKSRQESVQGFKIMQKLCQDSASSGQGRQRSPFTDEEVDLLSTYFDSYISGLEVPSSGACREFLANHCLDRDHKQVRDKVRHLIALKRKEMDS